MLPQLHQHMSPDQLRSIFHVDHVDLVPQYEVVQLQHHDPESAYHHVRKRAIHGTRASSQQQQLFDMLEKTLDTNHESVRHGKKDLSKNAYFSAAKKGSVISDKPSANKFKQFSGSNQRAAVQGEFVSSEGGGVDGNLRDDVVVNVDGETGRLDAPLPMPRNHNVSLKAFGEQLHLKLTPTEGLFKHGGPHTLRMWTVKPNPNASQGLDYEEVIEVSYPKRRAELSAALDPISQSSLFSVDWRQHRRDTKNTNSVQEEEGGWVKGQPELNNRGQLKDHLRGEKREPEFES